jgi:predicted GTPase
MAVGHDLRSCTSNLQHAFIEDKVGNRQHLKGRRIVIVDTPGFDDTYTEDREILRRIAIWLASS